MSDYYSDGTKVEATALAEVGYVKLFEDKISSRKSERPGLAAALDYLRPGDELAVWKIDRLGRSVKEVLTLADELHERGIGLRILTGAYTPTGEGKFFFTVITAFAELERDMSRQRTMAGLAAARARLARGEAITQIAKALEVSRATLYRHIDIAAARLGGSN